MSDDITLVEKAALSLTEASRALLARIIPNQGSTLWLEDDDVTQSC